jgi:hypothetical protein
MRNSLLIALVLIAISLISCRQDFDFEPSTGNLRFSKDTIYLDTVFANIGSSTYTLKVYNDSDKDISIPSIQLSKPNSKYRITVDGMMGSNNRVFTNVELLAKDSMFIFIETTATIGDANATDFLYTDVIEFNSVNQTQKVDLVTLIQDAIFIKPNRPLDTGIKETLIINGIASSAEGHELTDSELNWTNEKPYVIYGFALVPNGKTLTINQGTKVHYHAESGLIVDKNATLHINGEVSDYDEYGNIIVDREVTFEGDRLEPGFSNVAGQWGTVYILSQNNNTVSNLTVRNASIGFLVQPFGLMTNPIMEEELYQPKVTFTNTKFLNHRYYGLLARNAEITGFNVVANYCGQATVACTFGGKYNFTHSTFNNTWFSSNQLGILINNYYKTDTTQYINDVEEANFTNCIIYGSNQISMFIDKASEGEIQYKFDHCLIKFNNINNQYTNHSLYQFVTDTQHYNNCIIATNSNQNRPVFYNVNKDLLIIGEDSAAKGKADFIYSEGTQDILGKTRTEPSDIGAYNYIIFPEE